MTKERFMEIAASVGMNKEFAEIGWNNRPPSMDEAEKNSKKSQKEIEKIVENMLREFQEEIELSAQVKAFNN
jgi:translation elongation factor EF-Ts